MKIDVERCLELGLPVPKGCFSQKAYVLLCLSEGHTITTRKCQYIGINNLHSVMPKIRDMGIDLTEQNKPVYCYRAKEIDPDPVIYAYMTPEQIKAYLEWKKGGCNE